MRNIILVALATALTLVGCTTTPVAEVGQRTKEIHFRQLEGWAQDLSISTVIAVLNVPEGEVDFTIHYKSGLDRSISLFDPPNGDLIKFVTEGVRVGEGVVVIKGVSVKDLKVVREITLGFGVPKGVWCFASLNYYEIKRLIE